MHWSGRLNPLDLGVGTLDKGGGSRSIYPLRSCIVLDLWNNGYSIPISDRRSSKSGSLLAVFEDIRKLFRILRHVYITYAPKQYDHLYRTPNICHSFEQGVSYPLSLPTAA